MKKLEDYVITIPDFPKEGILFRDITGVLIDPDGFQLAIDALNERLKKYDYDKIVALDARGFLFATPLAYLNHKPIVLVRKKGKLPRKTMSQEYQLEYGTSVMEVHEEDIRPGDKLILVDDLLATGGSFNAAAKLVEKAGGTVTALLTVIELKGLNGRAYLKDYNVESIITYEGK